MGQTMQTDIVTTNELAGLLRQTPHNTFKLLSRAYIGRRKQRQLSHKLYSLQRAACLLGEVSGRPVTTDHLLDHLITTTELLQLLSDAGRFMRDSELRKHIDAGQLVPIRLGHCFRYPLSEARAFVEQVAETEVAA